MNSSVNLNIDYPEILIDTVRRPVTVRDGIGYKDNKKLFYTGHNNVCFDNCKFRSIDNYNNVANENLYRISKDYITDEVNIRYTALGCISKQYVMLTSRINNDIFHHSDPIYIFHNGIKLGFYDAEFFIKKPWSEIIPELEKILLLDKGSLDELGGIFVLLELGENNET